MTTRVLMRSDAPRREAAGKALRDAGVGVVEVNDWSDAPEALRGCGAALIVSNADLEALDAARLMKAVTELTGAPTASPLAPDAARALSHALRTPLSAMAGWIHLLDSGKLDPAGTKRALEKLRGNIEDQVRTLDRYVAGKTHEGHR